MHDFQFFGTDSKAIFDRSHSPTKLKVTSRISKSFTDDHRSTGVPGADCPQDSPKGEPKDTGVR
jgi:hypothetical protein